MSGMGPSELYVQERRHRRWAMNGRNGLQGYAQFLGGAGFADATDSFSPVLGSVVGADVAAMDSAAGAPALQAIGIGVATGVLTFLLNRWLGKVLG